MHDLKPNQRVPEGVDAQSWLGFEHRIGRRRFAALATAIDLATATGDLASAQAALEEARTLCPDAPELLRLETTVAAMTPTNDARLWTRAASAVALLVLGVSMVIGPESLRRVGEAPDTQAVAANVEPLPEPQPRLVVASSRSVEPTIAVERSRSAEPRRTPTPSARRSRESSRPTPPPSVPSRISEPPAPSPRPRLLQRRG